MGESLDSHRSFVNALADDLLVDYLNALPDERQRRPHTSPKEFNDPVWGTIIVSPLEICLIDSPIIQRLRGIRQLGVAHLVYPSAMHTRFEHVMGTCHLVGALVDSINKHKESVVVPPKLENTLRLTALCHDIGHGVMSHVSQNAASGSTECRRIIAEFMDEVVDIDSVSLSEINAYLIIDSPVFRRLIERLVHLYPNHELVDDPPTTMQNAIVGLPVENTIPLIQELITGPFDADKLDYMKRDAYMSGVPVVTDVGRLVQKVRSASKDLEHLSLEIAAKVRVGPSQFHVTGMAFSGARTLDELMLGILLFDKIYRHQKVRACEAMVSSILRTLSECTDLPISQLILSLTDDQVASLTPLTLAEVMGDSAVEQGRGADTDAGKFAIDLSRELGARRLWVRAYAFAQIMPFDAYRWEPEQAEGLRRLQRESRVNPRELATRIGNEALKVMESLEEPLPPGIIKARLSDYIDIDAPMNPPEPDDSAYLISTDDDLIRFRDEYAETRDWVKAYHLTRDVGYIFTPASIAPYVFVAAEKLLRIEYGIRTPSMATSYAHFDVNQVVEMKRNLRDRSYYSNTPYDTRPLPEILSRGDIYKRSETVVKRLEGYCGPVKQKDSRNKATLWHRDRMFAWIHQFGGGSLAEDALKVIEEVKHIDRRAVVAGVDDFMGATEGRFEGSALVPFGEPKDSSAIVTYYAGDLADSHNMTISALDLVRFDRPLLFVDDFVGTGSQAISIVEAWMGVEQTTTLSEQRAPLPPDEQARLRDAEAIAFVFASGTDAGRDAFKGRLSDLGINAEVFVCDSDIPRLSDADVSEDFIERCRQVGAATLASGVHDEEWVKHRVLGYGNEGYLMVFSHNTHANLDVPVG